MSAPRWVLSPGVDSSAMLSAVIWFQTKNQESWVDMGLQDQLTLVEHAMDEADPRPLTSGIRILKCPIPRGQCFRCSQGRSGYTFRWLSPLWVEKYKQLRRPGTWAPGDPEGCGLMMDFGQNFTGQLTTAQGHLVEQPQWVQSPPDAPHSREDC